MVLRFVWRCNILCSSPLRPAYIVWNLIDIMLEVNTILEFVCTNCGAVLNEQTGFRSDLEKWICSHCGQPLFADEAKANDITWYCDGCHAVLNEQDGFTDNQSKWVCQKCSFENDLSADNLYESEKEYYAQLKPEWKPFENGTSIGKTGTENGTILADEECEGYGRITLETCPKYDAVTCGVYGSMVHTAFSDKEHSKQMYQSLKAELMAFFESDIDDPDKRYEFYERFTEK